jgi:hypothetical protein
MRSEIISLRGSKIWDLKQETLIYLNKDLKSLLQVLNEFSKI